MPSGGVHPIKAVARDFAELRRVTSGGSVVLVVAPPEAILLVRDEEYYFDEAEVVVDPFKLGKVTVRERLSPVEDGPA
jgi:hypothetical protein